MRSIILLKNVRGAACREHCARIVMQSRDPENRVGIENDDS